MQYLVDTGVWLRLFDRTDPQHAAIHAALRLLRSDGHSLAIQFPAFQCYQPVVI